MILSSTMANKRFSPHREERMRKVESPALLLLQSQTQFGQSDLTCLIQSAQVEEEQNVESVTVSVSPLSQESERSINKSESCTSITDTFGSSRVEDSRVPGTSILGTGWEGEGVECWRKCSADTTHDISDLELDTEYSQAGSKEREADPRRHPSKQCVLL